MQSHYSDYNDNRHFHPSSEKDVMIRVISTKGGPRYSADLLQHSVLKGNA